MVKYVFCCFYIGFIVLNFLPILFNFDEESAFQVKTAYNESFFQMIAVFILCMSFFTYCEFKLCVLFYSPLLLVSIYFYSTAQQEHLATIRATTEPKLQNMLKDQTGQNLIRALMITCNLCIAKYI